MRKLIWRIKFSIIAYRFYGKHSWNMSDCALDMEIEFWGNNPEDWNTPKEALRDEISYSV